MLFITGLSLLLAACSSGSNEPAASVTPPAVTQSSAMSTVQLVPPTSASATAPVGTVMERDVPRQLEALGFTHEDADYPHDSADAGHEVTYQFWTRMDNIRFEIADSAGPGMFTVVMVGSNARVGEWQTFWCAPIHLTEELVGLIIDEFKPRREAVAQGGVQAELTDVSGIWRLKVAEPMACYGRR